ncbi:hypothetical protein MX850_02005 [Erysipelothrix sp. Poltava]|nr:hypothetical protein MX850_02005 [Erysipelothrix sp. Poltava]
MEKLTSWMEEHFVPIAIKIGSQKHLVAIRDAFISIMPITMAGSVAVLLNALVRDLPAKFGADGITDAFSWLIGINGNIWFGTLAILGFSVRIRNRISIIQSLMMLIHWQVD